MSITVTYRKMGVDVPPTDPGIDLIQFDSPAPIFDANVTTVDVTWGGTPIHYNPNIPGPAPAVTYASAFRISVGNSVGAPVATNTILGAINGDVQGNVIVIDPNDGNVGIYEGQVTSSGGSAVGGAADFFIGPWALGSGGAVIGTPEHLPFGIGSGIPPELTTNQWGLFGFAFRSRLEERL